MGKNGLARSAAERLENSEGETEPMKSLFGRGAFFATALLTASVLFYAHPLAAEPAFQDPTRQPKKELPAAISVSATLDALETPVVNDERADESFLIAGNNPEAPPASGSALAKAGHKNGSPEMAGTRPQPPQQPAVAPAQSFVATAYNLSGRTASGRPVAKGIIAADPGLLPLGTRVRLDAGPYSGEYLVSDTGGGVRGRKIDVWVPTTREACRFGRRNVKLTVLTYGAKKKGAQAGK